MKKIKTILKQISELEKELYSNYSTKDILSTIEKMYHENKKYYGMNDGLLSIIYNEVYDDQEISKYFNDNYKDAFLAYERVRQSGKYNMITEADKAARDAHLSMDTYRAIIKNYNILKEEFKDLL